MFDEEESFGLSLNLKSDKLLLSLLKMLLCISKRQKGHDSWNIEAHNSSIGDAI